MSRSYGRGASILSVGIATTGLVTFAYFSLASHSLSEVDYKGVSLLWSILFLIISIIYRPVEQLLSHTIASRRAQGHEAHPLRVAFTIQMSAAALFLVVALAFREPIQDDVFDGSAELYWVLVVAVVAYAASYFARGWLAGHQWFGLYGGLVLLESVSRCLFALAVAIGIAEGQGAVALGIAAAPLVSLAVVPWALTRHGARATTSERGAMRESAGFAGAVLAIMVAEQALLNGPVLVVDATATDAALAGFVFNVLLITRAPLQLFQAIQTSLLPHLSGLHATGGGDDFAPRDPHDGPGDRRLRGARGARPRADRPVGDGAAVRRRLRLRPLGPRPRRPRHGLPPHRRHAQPGRAGAAQGPPGGRRLAGGGRAVHAVARAFTARRPRAGGRGGLLRHDRAAGRGAVAYRAYRRICALSVLSVLRSVPLALTRPESQRGRLAFVPYQL